MPLSGEGSPPKSTAKGVNLFAAGTGSTLSPVWPPSAHVCYFSVKHLPPHMLLVWIGSLDLDLNLWFL